LPYVLTYLLCVLLLRHKHRGKYLKILVEHGADVVIITTLTYWL
jgi:hypothetical protein